MGRGVMLHSQASDSIEDDFELSTVCHRPEGLEKLQEQTKFTKKELQVLYRGFKKPFGQTSYSKQRFVFQECPSGVVNEDTFKVIYSQFFPQGDSSTYAHFLFEAFDTNKNGSVSFEDFVIGLRVHHQRGDVGHHEVHLRYDGKYTYPCMQEDAPREHVETFFQKMDRNNDGVVTIDEFIESCQKDENIMQSMQLFDNVI
ncbi:hypothetical protein SRHO_G00255500 [Serrasalmus rhombeus]